MINNLANGFCGFGGYGGFGMMGGFMMLLFWVAIAVGIYLLVKNANGGSSSDYKKSLKETLTEKFISGEITKEEYEEKMSVIEKMKK